MSKQTITIINDDLDGSEGAETVSFALQGTEYSIDLSPKNLAKLEKSLGPFIEAGTKVSARRSPRRSKSASSKPDSAAIRQWGRDNGYEVPTRGRVPQAVVEAYEAAH